KFIKPVIIAGYRAGADVGARPYIGVADIGEVIGLGAGAEPGRLDLDEIADMHLFFEHRTRAQPGEGTDPGARSDRGAFEIGKRADPSPLPDRDTGAEGNVRLDDDIAAEPGVGAEKHGLRRHQSGARFHYPAAQPPLHQRLSLREFRAGVDPDQLLGRELDRAT